MNETICRTSPRIVTDDDGQWWWLFAEAGDAAERIQSSVAVERLRQATGVSPK